MVAGFLLSIQDSNLDWLIQSQMCYHYTNGQSLFFSRERSFVPLKSGCKSTTFLSNSKVFFYNNLFCIDCQVNIFYNHVSRCAAKTYIKQYKNGFSHLFELVYLLHKMPFGSRGKRRVAALVLRHVCLPFRLTGKLGQPRHVAFPVKVVNSVAYHKDSVPIAIYLHVEDAHFTLPIHHFAPHMGVNLYIFTNQLFIIGKFQCLTVTFHFFWVWIEYNEYKSTTLKQTTGTKNEV